jgi:hypothetical protein
MITNTDHINDNEQMNQSENNLLPEAVPITERLASVASKFKFVFSSY